MTAKPTNTTGIQWISCFRVTANPSLHPVHRGRRTKNGQREDSATIRVDVLRSLISNVQLSALAYPLLLLRLITHHRRPRLLMGPVVFVMANQIRPKLDDYSAHDTLCGHGQAATDDVGKCSL